MLLVGACAAALLLGMSVSHTNTIRDLTRDGHVFEGVNVENAAYPLGMCAEKAAIAAAVTAGYRPGDLEAIGITASPCGGCRQWLFEFRLERVTFANTHGEIVSYRPEDLLPETWELPG